MNGIQKILHALHKLSGGLLFRDYSKSESTNAMQDTKPSTWKVDWIDEQGNKGTYETNETDLEEAEWKFKYLYDDNLRVIKIHQGKSNS